MDMNMQKSDDGKLEQTGDDGLLVKIARKINPPSREVSDEELIDPGANTPDSPAKDDKDYSSKPSDA
jgi:hypothetical protein